MRRTFAVPFAMVLACGSDGGSGPSGSGSSGEASGDASTLGSTTRPDGSDDTSAGEAGGPTAGSSTGFPGADTSSSGDSESGGSDETTGGPQTCAVVDVMGTCDEVLSCGPASTAFQGICEGVPSIQCCVPVAPPCSVEGAPGLCMPVDACPAGLVTTPGLCPGDATVQCCTDPATACDPEAMPTPNEGLEEEPFDPTCPDGMIRAGEVCIDRFEASLIVLDEAGRSVGHHSPYFNPGETRVRAVSLRGAIPQGYVSQIQAAEACAEAGKRLCSDDEWLRACQGASGSTYPYGAALQPGWCNDARAQHPVVEYFGTVDPWIWSELDHPCISQIPDSLHLTGQHEACLTEEGAFDMMGNLHEWTADPAGTFRGGFYVDTAINGPGCLYATTAHDVTHWDYSTGFRCCADPV